MSNTNPDQENKPTEEQQKLDDLVDTVVNEIERRRGTPKNRFLVFMHNYSIELFSAVLIGFLVTVTAALFPNLFPFLDEADDSIYVQAPLDSMDSSQATNRGFYVQAKLSQVLSHMNIPKMLMAQHIMATGELPSSLSDLGVTVMDLKEYDEIEEVFLTERKGIAARLSLEFGENKFVVLQPALTASGSFIKWQCLTNIDQRNLGLPATSACAYSENY